MSHLLYFLIPLIIIQIVIGIYIGENYLRCPWYITYAIGLISGLVLLVFEKLFHII